MYDVTRMGWGHYFPNPTSQSCCWQVSLTLAWSRKSSLTMQPLAPDAGSCREPAAPHSQQHCIEAGSTFCRHLCTTNLSLPPRQSRAQYYYITSCYIMHYTTTWKGEQFNVKAQSQEKLKQPGRLELQRETATYIAYYFTQVQHLGFSNLGHLLVASQHTYIPIMFCNIKYWLLFIHISPCNLSSSSY